MSATASASRFARLENDALAALLALDAQTNPHPWNSQQWQDTLAAHDCFGLYLTSESGETLAGFAIFMRTLDEAELLLIATAPAQQRSGLGSLLLRNAEQQLIALGARQFFLEVRASNARARAFYCHHGWNESGVRKNYYRGAASEREDAILYSKVIASEVAA